MTDAYPAEHAKPKRSLKILGKNVLLYTVALSTIFYGLLFVLGEPEPILGLNGPVEIIVVCLVVTGLGESWNYIKRRQS